MTTTMTADIITPVCDEIEKYVYLEDTDRLIAVALWSIFTHAFDVFPTNPRLCVSSPLENCGKGTLYTVLEGLVATPKRNDSITAAALYHMRGKPTLLLDEVDNNDIKKGTVLNSVFNSGFSRRHGTVDRVINGNLKSFDAYYPIALAGVQIDQSLPDTLRSRCIIINMVPMPEGEDREDVDFVRDSHFKLFSNKIRLWIGANKNAHANARPKAPDGLRNRQWKKWAPLVAIADVVSPKWGETARDVAVRMERRTARQSNPGLLILHDIRSIFARKNFRQGYRQDHVGHIYSADLAKALAHRVDAYWGNYNHRGPISPADVSKLLAGFDIKPMQIFREGVNRNGYNIMQFENSWKNLKPFRELGLPDDAIALVIADEKKAAEKRRKRSDVMKRSGMTKVERQLDDEEKRQESEQETNALDEARKNRIKGPPPGQFSYRHATRADLLGRLGELRETTYTPELDIELA